MSYGFGMLKIDPGATVTFEQTRVNDEIWLPAHASIRFNGSAALFVPIRDEIDMQFRDYRKFQAESQIVIDGPAKSARRSNDYARLSSDSLAKWSTAAAFSECAGRGKRSTPAGVNWAPAKFETSAIRRAGSILEAG